MNSSGSGFKIHGSHDVAHNVGLILAVARTCVVALVLVLLPLADSFGALAINVLSPSLVLRLLVYALGCVVLMSSGAVDKRTKVSVALVFLYFLIQPALHLMSWKRSEVLTEELTSVVKMLYFPFVVVLLMELAAVRAVTRASLRKSLTFLGCLVIVSLVLGKVTGLGGEIKGRGSGIEAAKGFMVGANEVGLMLLLTLPYVTRLCATFARSEVAGTLLGGVAYGFCGVVVFTKSSLAAAAVAIGKFLQEGMTRGSVARRATIIALSIAAAGMVFVHFEPAIQVAFNAFAGPLMSRVGFLDVLSFVFRGRQDYVQAIAPSVVNSDFSGLYFWFGSGEHFLRMSSVGPLHRSLDDATNFEMDGLDLLGYFGVIGAGLYIGIVWALLRKLSMARLEGYEVLTLVLLVLHSLLAGHVLFSPQVSSLAALVLVSYSKHVGTHVQ